MSDSGRQSLTLSMRWPRSWLLTLMAAICCWSPYGFAVIDDSSVFDIDAGPLSGALIDFSRQSGLYIVFSDKLTRHLQVDAVIGRQTNEHALEKLLDRSGLDWEAVDDRIVAVFEASCADNRSNPRDCPGAAATLSKYPVYTGNRNIHFLCDSNVRHAAFAMQQKRLFNPEGQFVHGRI